MDTKVWTSKYGRRKCDNEYPKSTKKNYPKVQPNEYKNVEIEVEGIRKEYNLIVTPSSH